MDDEKTHAADNEPFAVELDRTADISPYTEPERYAAAREKSARDFAQLDRELERLRPRS